MRIVVIGASGNVGTAVLRRLRRARVEAIVGVSRRRPENGDAYRDVEWHEIDIARPESVSVLEQVLAGADAVIHLAWLIQPNHRERVLYATNVTGTAHVLDAAGRGGVAQVVYASSVGAYSPGPKSRPVDEGWPTGGIHTSHYSRHKAMTERLVDDFEAAHPEVVVTRLRPGLIFQADAGSEIDRYFVGPLLPTRALRFLRPPLLPLPDEFVFQAVHADDVADAYWRVVDQRAPGAFNIAADPVLDPVRVARAMGGRGNVPLPLGVVRAAAAATWRLHLQRSDPGWVDMAALAPVMSTARARTELGWRPGTSSEDAAEQVVAGMAAGTGVHASPALKPKD